MQRCITRRLALTGDNTRGYGTLRPDKNTDVSAKRWTFRLAFRAAPALHDVNCTLGYDIPAPTEAMLLVDSVAGVYCIMHAR